MRAAAGSWVLVMSLLGCATAPDGLPDSLRAAAESGVAHFADEPQVRRQYLDSFRRGAIDALIWTDQVQESRGASAEACERGTDAQMRTIECGYADGAAAVLSHAAAVTLADFGYLSTAAVGRVAARTDSQLRHLERVHQQPWLLAPSPVADRLETGSCYRLEGYVAPGKPDRLRYPDFSSEFIVLEAVPASSCDAPGGD